MAANELDVRYVAQLANLNLTDEEATRFQEQIGHVVQHIVELEKVDVSGVEISAHESAIFNVFREDEPRDWFSAEDALGNAPRQANGLFIVPKVVE
jgi:aspartyl-tRNA(Asn)/glutamyl-tRNA(Gln) amidotransferase subunit C